MAEYKKKNIKKAKLPKKHIIGEEIEMTHTVKPKPQNIRPKNNYNDSKKAAKTSKNPTKERSGQMRVIHGNRLKKRQKRVFTVVFVGLLVCALLIISALTPTGMFESISNGVAVLTSNSAFPSSISGGDVVNTVDRKHTFFVVSSTEVTGFSNNGGQIFNFQHGYEKPIIKTSAARTLLFNQGDTGYQVFNLKKQTVNNNSQNKILCGNIARNGNYAIATTSDSYSSQVTVYNKNNIEIYSWFCSEYIINDVLISDNGKTLAVSAVNAEHGNFVSKLYIIKYDSATPVMTYTFSGELLLSLSQSDNNCFMAAFENKIEFYSWKKYNNSTYSTDRSLSYLRTASNTYLTVFNHTGNTSDNEICVFSGVGALKSKFLFDGIIDDIQSDGKHIYILSDKKIIVFDTSGEKLCENACEFGIVSIIPISGYSIAAVRDNIVTEINLK